jgi:hypothetical protein
MAEFDYSDIEESPILDAAHAIRVSLYAAREEHIPRHGAAAWLYAWREQLGILTDSEVFYSI